MGRPREQDIPQNLTIRFDPKLRYLTELAARIKGVALRDYIEGAVLRSLSEVSLRTPDVEEPLYGVHPQHGLVTPKRQNSEDDREHSVAAHADALWHDNPYARLEVIALSRPWLLTPEEEKLWKFLHSRDEVKIKAEDGEGYRMDRKKIAEQWMQLKAAAEKWRN